MNQYNLKNKGGKSEIKKNRTYISPRDSALLKPTTNRVKEDEYREEKED